ncbi:MAG TPA: hypothetical protein VKY22_18715 [Bradyrhizobium sp.]|nr:hypothetical protein [Bradyrhizobium sp.]
MKDWWRKWSYEVPLFISDALWDVLVVQFAAWLDRLTLRRVIALIPLVLLIVAYAHSIPLPPELMLVGDVLAYIDIFSVVLLLGILSRAATLVFFARQAARHALEFAGSLLARLPRPDFRHRRQPSTSGRKQLPGRTEEDGGCIAVFRMAWA